jgi:hypothetical protein
MDVLYKTARQMVTVQAQMAKFNIVILTEYVELDNQLYLTFPIYRIFLINLTLSQLIHLMTQSTLNQLLMFQTKFLVPQE